MNKVNLPTEMIHPAAQFHTFMRQLVPPLISDNLPCPSHAIYDAYFFHVYFIIPVMSILKKGQSSKLKVNWSITQIKQRCLQKTNVHTDTSTHTNKQTNKTATRRKMKSVCYTHCLFHSFSHDSK